MPAQVTITQTAIDKMQHMKTLTQSDFTQLISRLNEDGSFLSTSGEWEGQLHRQFVEQWQQFHENLKTMETALTEFNDQIQRIARGIEEAGGGF